MLSDRIKQCRKRLNMTQMELAERIGRKEDSISRWERGLCNPDARDLANLAQTFGTTAAYLMEETDLVEPNRRIRPVVTRATWIAEDKLPDSIVIDFRKNGEEARVELPAIPKTFALIREQFFETYEDPRLDGLMKIWDILSDGKKKLLLETVGDIVCGFGAGGGCAPEED